MDVDFLCSSKIGLICITTARKEIWEEWDCDAAPEQRSRCAGLFLLNVIHLTPSFWNFSWLTIYSHQSYFSNSRISSISSYSEPTLDSDCSELNDHSKYKINAESDSENNNSHLLIITIKYISKYVIISENKNGIEAVQKKILYN